VTFPFTDAVQPGEQMIDTPLYLLHVQRKHAGTGSFDSRQGRALCNGACWAINVGDVRLRFAKLLVGDGWLGRSRRVSRGILLTTCDF
jgi:hypothetical protein